MPDAWSLTATELAAAFATGETTPERALSDVLHRLEAINPVVNAVVTLDLPGAHAAAAAAGARLREGRRLGPLDGIPLTVKDNLFVGGLRATWGSAVFEDFVAPQDDLPVAKLRAAGAVIFGKTNTPELALMGATDNRVFGSTGNPWSPDLSPGGSSGGAVAGVASGAGPLALATDAGGSIRRPSGHAGVAGLKPGVGRVPRRFGFPPLAHDLQVIGPIGRCVTDLQAMLGVIATPLATPAQSGTGLRIAAFGAIGNHPVEPAISSAFEAALDVLRALGHSVTVIGPLWDPDAVSELFGLLASVGVARVMAANPGWDAKVTEGIAQQARAGSQVSGTAYVEALDRLALFRWGMLDAVAGWNVIATPSSPALPWQRTEMFPKTIAGIAVGGRAASIFSTAVNLAGLPALVVPAPVASGALPAGLQLIGGPMTEEMLLDLGAQFERACPWPRIAPMPQS
jgi:aspartyl-tRNA(Asn)/glutamyl-tRNA(Gln) amidotransferase subunit A